MKGAINRLLLWFDRTIWPDQRATIKQITSTSITLDGPLEFTDADALQLSEPGGFFVGQEIAVSRPRPRWWDRLLSWVSK